MYLKVKFPFDQTWHKLGGSEVDGKGETIKACVFLTTGVEESCHITYDPIFLDMYNTCECKLSIININNGIKEPTLCNNILVLMFCGYVRVSESF